MDITDYFEKVYSTFEKSQYNHHNDFAFSNFSIDLASTLSQMIKSVRSKTQLEDISALDFKFVIKKNGENKSNKQQVVDYSKINHYFQAYNPSMKTCVRIALSPLNDSNAIIGLYSSFEPVDGNKFSKGTYVESESIFNRKLLDTSTIIYVIVMFLLTGEAQSFHNNENILLH